MCASSASSPPRSMRSSSARSSSTSSSALPGAPTPSCSLTRPPASTCRKTACASPGTNHTFALECFRCTWCHMGTHIPPNTIVYRNAPNAPEATPNLPWRPTEGRHGVAVVICVHATGAQAMWGSPAGLHRLPGTACGDLCSCHWSTRHVGLTCRETSTSCPRGPAWRPAGAAATLSSSELELLLSDVSSSELSSSPAAASASSCMRDRCQQSISKADSARS